MPNACLVSNQQFLRDTTSWVTWKVLRVNEKLLKMHEIYSLMLLNIWSTNTHNRPERIEWNIRYSLKYILRQLDWMLRRRLFQTSQSSYLISTNPASFWVLEVLEVPTCFSMFFSAGIIRGWRPKGAVIHILHVLREEIPPRSSVTPVILSK